MGEDYRAEEIYFCKEKERNQTTLVGPLLQVYSSLLMSPNSVTLGLILSIFLICCFRKLNKYYCDFKDTFHSMIKYVKGVIVIFISL